MFNNKPIREQKFPEPVVGALIYNDEGKILLVRGPKFGDWWCFSGGHVEVGETSADAVVREVKEELGVDVDSVEFITWMDAINPEFYHKQAHFLFLDFSARYVSGEIRTNEEISEYVWMDPAEAMQKLTINPYSKTAIEMFVEKRSASSIEAKCEEYKAGWQRALADYKNLQKETQERKTEWAQMSEQFILEEFIPVYDNFKKAFAHHPLLNDDSTNKQVKNWINGIGYIQKQFWDVLKAHQIEEIKTVGEKFDTKFHEAAGEEAADGKPSGTILREVDGGYIMNGRVIKVAKVIISQ